MSLITRCSTYIRGTHEVRVTTICLLLFLSIPTSAGDGKLVLGSHHEATRWRRNNKVNIPRLYSAYRVLLKDGVAGSDAKIDVGHIAKRIAIAGENDENSAGLREKAKGVSSIDYSNTAKGKCKDVEDDKSGKEESTAGHPAVQGMVIPQKDESLNTKGEKPKSTGTVAIPQSHIDEMENRIAELNRVYQSYVNVWKRPTIESKELTLLDHKNKFPSPNYRLSALNALVNVVETLKQSNPVDEIVKAINNEMNTEKETPVGSIKLNVRDQLAPASQSREKNKRITDRSSNVVKFLIPKVTSDMKTGGVYEECKKKLNDILQAHTNTHSSLNEAQRLPAHRCSAEVASMLAQCHCDSAKPVVMAVDSDGQKVTKDETACYCEVKRPANWAIEGLMPCYCDGVKGGHLAEALTDGQAGKTTLYMEGQEKASQQSSKENNLNGGLKPYYLSNSKHRQMVWNDVPLMRPGISRKGDAVKQYITTVPKGGANQPSICVKSSREKLRNLTVNQNKLHHILRFLQTKHRAIDVSKAKKRGLNDGLDGTPTDLAFPEVLVQKLGQPQETAGRLIENMAKQLNVSPVEMAQRIAASSGAVSGPSIATGMYPDHSHIASQINGWHVPTMASNLKAQQAQAQGFAGGNLAPILEKILSRLQTLQEASSDQGSGNKLPCCFAEPSDGAPCQLTGSWESALLGIRVNIRDDLKIVVPKLKPTCMQPKLRRSDTDRFWRQCVKITPAEIRERLKSSTSPAMNKALNITIEETLPPRQHEMLENLTEWIFTGHTINTLGGPISINCRHVYSSLIGTFVGFCRRCGCIDTIFGSWTFCHPSRDCQDITMSMFERRDVLRRYTLDDARKERYKEQLYTKQIFQNRE
ncbi:uncharacterized protein LOC111599430 isoform X2 [Drosophila hydei]|uniref:Uncharacterized protein LOC111599430 isoform X2 n=1 Tax=Drosophila hydei TaxID=7224 RepID=A0A6J1LUU5_DROHY|nr:uncharacterized protein LOC111599430 isoform X2 [Drosophila hydei]